MSLKINDFFSTFKTSARALSNEKRQLAITAENIANAKTTKTIDGTPYRRKLMTRKNISPAVPFSHALRTASLQMRTSSGTHMAQSHYVPESVNQSGSSLIKTEVNESNQFRDVYDPSHPDANEEGIVRYPNINVVSEMLELISSSRSYEANLAVMGATKNMAERSLQV